MMQKLLNRSLIILFLFVVVRNSHAQQTLVSNDLKTINESLSKNQSDPYKRSYLYKGESSFFKKINPLRLLAGGSLYVYQNLFSKHFSADCLYTPSCSEFSKQAIGEYGLLKGSILTIDRLNRCNRIAAQDLKRYSLDTKTRRYPDPVSRYKKTSHREGV
jgi:uncharacterized protein